LYKDLVRSQSIDGDLLLNDSEHTKEPAEKVEIDFQGLYFRFAESTEVEVREVVAACIHEPFLLRADDEDINILQMIVCELMEENERKVATALASNLHIVI
jgi:hypothetical protein